VPDTSQESNREAPSEVHELVRRFAEHAETYGAGGSGSYNETQIRREFIDPLFKALGWDIDNTAGYAEAYKDVIHEDAIKIGGATKAPDYCFRIGGVRKFFVEAKKPAVDIKADSLPAFQLRRYAWSAKLPLSILTDFEEIAVYDCRIKPAKTDKASTARTLFLRYDELPDRWHELAAIFSREAVLKGSFDKYAESAKKKRGTAEVDDAFLAEIEDWRDMLARTIALRNEHLSQRDLNFAVQRTIDRIVFLRICEDRGIEPYGTLQALTNGERVYDRLFERFRRADERYNSGLFHFSEEKGRSDAPDDLTPGITIDDKPLKEILTRLYYPECPYEFSVLPADILGHVYEQFLGKVIRLTPGHRAVVEEKPEVRKAGGVYYTPTYIVDYIVQNTVGKLVEDKTPQEVGGLTATYQPSKAKDTRPLSVLDPACGSGSFLLGAYQFLLDWYRDQYVNDGPRKHTTGKSPRLYQHGSGEYRLTTNERKRILLSHIHGVDIDSQAVEVTKLSLLLKVLEGESAERLDAGLRLFHERALPDLGANIKCGNSLIGPDFYDNTQMNLFDEEERLRINVFDWHDEFTAIVQAGGFDAVLGNPPYVYRNAIEDVGRDYFGARFDSAEGNFELYKFFLERGVSLLGHGGRLGMIVSASFLVQPSFTKLRSLLLQRTQITNLAPLGPGVFEGATVDTCVIVVQCGTDGTENKVNVVSPRTPLSLMDTRPYPVPQRRFLGNVGHVFDYRLSEPAALLLRRLLAQFPALEKDFELGVGINTGFIKDELVSDKKVDNRYHRMVPGTGIARYGSVTTKGWIMYDPDFVRSRGKEGRSLPQQRFFDSPKILVVRTRNLSLKRRIIATIDRGYNLNRLSNIIARGEASIDGLLGLLNSRLFNWLFSTRWYDYEIKPVYLRDCPVSDASHPRLQKQVAQMMELQELMGLAKTPHAKKALQRQIDATDRQIDKLVYELYGLTDEEIRIVEEATA
jgi:predicted type IV restriction endonuclease